MARAALELEAFLWLVCARIATACLPFRAIAWFLARPREDRVRSAPERRLRIRAVKAAVRRLWRRRPQSTTCLHRALVVHVMLRRQGVATTLHYGARRLPGRGLTGHVWLQDGSERILGAQAAQGFTCLAAFPHFPVSPFPEG